MFKDSRGNYLLIKYFAFKLFCDIDFMQQKEYPDRIGPRLGRRTGKSRPDYTEISIGENKHTQINAKKVKLVAETDYIND